MVRFACWWMLVCGPMTSVAAASPLVSAESFTFELERPVLAPKARRMRDAGIVVTGVGAAFLLPGAFLVIDGATANLACDEFTPADCGWGVALQVGFGGLLTAISVPFLATGIPLWVVGQNRIRRAREGDTSIGLVPVRGRGLQLSVTGSF